MKWISVKDRLPELDKRVLGAGKVKDYIKTEQPKYTYRIDIVSLGKWTSAKENDGRYWINESFNESWLFDEIEFWMELPELPKEQE